MKFTINRTSGWEHEKPCDEAISYTVLDTKDNSTKKCWAIEINTLEELIALYHKYGASIIVENIFDDKITQH